MRIIGGKLKGRRLSAVRSAGIRPTSDRVRESLFGILREAVPGARFLDVFAGTGSVGIEAYSRSAAEVVMIESKPSASLKQNLQRCGLGEVVRLLAMPAQRAMAQLDQAGEVFDIVFMDPPYDSPLIHHSLQLCADSSILSPDGCLVAEHRRQTLLEEAFGSLIRVRTETYGDTLLSFYVWDD